MDEFNNKIENTLSLIDSQVLSYSNIKFMTFQNVYHYIEEYAFENKLYNTIISLNVLRGSLLKDNNDLSLPFKIDGISRKIYFNHAITIASNIIDLHTHLSAYELDIALSAGLCHVLVEKMKYKNKGQELVSLYHIDEEVLKIIKINLRNHRWSEAEKKKYYKNIQENKLALLVKIADRGNIVEQLFETSIYNALEYVEDTKYNFLPMCIYGKEHYPDLYFPLCIQMDKMKQLIDATYIISTKYLQRFNALNEEILSLKEENARLRVKLNKK